MELHGGNVWLAAKKFPGIAGFLDYSANINPLGVPSSLKKALPSVVLDCYPDPEYSGAREALAGLHGVSPENILLANGSVEIIYAAFAGAERVVIPVPSFAEYERAARICGCEPVFFTLERARGFRPDMDKLCHFAKAAGAALICNPNNPTGGVYSHMEALLDTGALIILDEAFVDFVAEDISAVRLVRRYDNLIIIRSLTKFFGIPGVRIGYAIASDVHIERMRGRIAPWSVNAFAETAARVLPFDDDYIARTRAWLENEAPRFQRELAGLDGVTVYPSAASFVLLRMEGAAQMYEYLARRGILIRRAGNFRGLDETFLRVAIRDRQSNEILVKNLKEGIRELHS